MPNKVRKLGGSFMFPGTSITVHRMGYGAMQLAGPGVWDRRAIRRLLLLCCGKQSPLG
jgi:hypothetical protein